jgi:TonB family protein
VAAGYAPALSQDFSITNMPEAVGPGSAWINQLEAWWILHAYYPPDASEKNKDGTVKVNLTIHPDGEVWKIAVVQPSGWQSIDVASWVAFQGAHLRPLPPTPPAAEAEVNLTLHFVLGHLQSRPAFTITTDPVHGTVVDTNVQKLCTGTVSQPWPGPEGGYYAIEATWYRKTDGSPWVKFYWAGKGPLDIPLIELSVSPQWHTPPVTRMSNTWVTRYAVWPDGDNRLTGTTVDPYGTFELTCGPAPAE